MRKIFVGLSLSLTLGFTPSFALALEYKSQLDLSQSVDSVAGENIFYTKAMQLVQQQIYLIARLEQALSSSDPNRMRSVRGQLTVYTHSVETFLKRQYPSPKTLCTAKGELSQQSDLTVQLTDSQLQIYCSLYAANQELLKLSPVTDRLLSRRGELGLVRKLPLVSGERKSDLVISIAPVQRPDLSKPATPFIPKEPNLTSSPLPVVGSPAKTAIAKL
ncbi:MAG: hypothetical protein ACKO2Z_00765 [Sphaerospermopsis kisseleviana]